MLSFLWQLSTKIGVPLNAEVISEDARQFAYWGAPNYGHDTAINPIIVWLLIICIVWTIIRFRKINWKGLYQSYPLVAIASFLVFCTVLRWEPFVTRYMLSFLALLCPAIALMLQKQLCKENGKKGITNKMTGFGYIVVGVIGIFCVVDMVNMSEYQPECIIWYGAVPAEVFVWNGQEYPNVIEIAENRYVLTAE